MQEQRSNLTPTEVQRLASDPNSSVFVSASAGTGKTKILCDRFTRLMLNGCKPSNILCVTFTKAAAREMEERIRDKLLLWQHLPEDELRAQLIELKGEVFASDIGLARSLAQEFIKELNQIKILTLHSFCSNILKNYVDNHGLPYVFDVLSDVQAQLLLKEAFHSAIEAEGAECLLQLAEHSEFTTVFGDICSILSKKNKFIAFLKHAQHTGKSLKEFLFALHGADVFATVEGAYQVFWENVKPVIEPLALLLNSSNLSAAYIEQDFAAFKQIFLTIEGKPRAALIKKLGEDGRFKFALNEIQRVIGAIKAIITARGNYNLISLAQKMLHAYEESKQKKHWLDYDDLLMRTLELLENSPNASNILYNLDYKIDHILVDEAQDLSEAQWEIIKILADEFFAGISARELNRTIFIVGDYKQSIYSFQGANPSVFLQMQEYFRSKARDAQKAWHEINLEVSFRSTEPVLLAVDKFFNKNEINKALGVDFNINHKPFKKGCGRVEILPLIQKIGKAKAEGWRLPTEEKKEDNPKALLARAIADKVHDWLQKKRTIRGDKQLLKPSDILILIRKRSDLTVFLGQELSKYGIPVVNQDKILLKDELIVKDLTAVVRFVTGPADDFNLACLLKSPFFNVTEEELFNLAFGRGETSLIARVSNPRHSATLQLLREVYSNASSQAFFRELLEQMDFREAFIKRFGNKANIIIDAFYTAIDTYFSENCGTLLGFVEWLENNDIEIASTSQDDALRIMTCHTAKGLQAPIVIIADAASSEQSPVDKVIWMDGYPFYSVGSAFNTPLITEVKERSRTMQKEEGYRLLYVAMTRAEQELYIAGWENNRLNNSWYEKLSASEIESREAYTYNEEALPLPISNQKLPEWMKTKLSAPVDIEEYEFASKQSLVKTMQMLRGEIMHELIRICLTLSGTQAEKLLNVIASRYRGKFSQEDIKEAYAQAKALVNTFGSILAGGMAEVSIFGRIENSMVSARIDWLKVEGDVVKIFDFKTDEKPNPAKPEYLMQLCRYKELAKQYYQTDKIECYLIWVMHNQLTKV